MKKELSVSPMSGVCIHLRFTTTTEVDATITECHY